MRKGRVVVGCGRLNDVGVLTLMVVKLVAVNEFER